MSNTHKVTTDALATLGTIIDDKAGRDAIHIAVMPVVANEKLFSGQDIGLLADGKASGRAAKHLGIVDPFLDTCVEKGERCWMLIYPRVITSLRHVWAHPDIADEAPSNVVETPIDQEARDEIMKLADTAGISYEEMMEYARVYQETGEYACQGGRWEGMGAGDQFWEAYEKITGKKVADRGGIFSCSC